MDYRSLFFSHQFRLNRQPYWLASLALTVVQMLILAIATDESLQPVAAVLYLVSLWPIIMLAIKRCRDRDRSGWFLLLLFVPILNVWVMIELLFLPGTPGPNRFGPDPLGGTILSYAD